MRWGPSDGIGPEAIEYEADPRHAEIALAQLGLVKNAKAVSTPGIKRACLEGDELKGQQRSVYRSICMRLAYLALDRPDLQFSAKEAARCMQSPTTGGWEALKRIGRYLIGCPRVVTRYPRQPPPKKLVICTDSDFASCLKARKSTSSMTVRFALADVFIDNATDPVLEHR